MDTEIKTIVYDLFQFRRSKSEATSVFTKMKHNSDLCPKVQRKLESALDSFEKYRRITYDIQGPRDAGADVILRQVLEEEAYFICSQIKSEADLKEKDWLKTLKAQWFDAQKTYQTLQDYYIIACCDILKHKQKIRVLESEFAENSKVHVIEPEYALSFIRLSLTQIDAIIKSKFGSEDIIFRNALSISNGLTPTENALLFIIIWFRVYQNSDCIEPHTIFDSSFIKYVYEHTPDFVGDWFFEDEFADFYGDDESEEYTIRGLDMKERIMLDLDSLQDVFVQMDEVGNYLINLNEVQPLVILMMDGNERYKYNGNELLFYMMDLFGPHKGYEPREDVEAFDET